MMRLDLYHLPDGTVHASEFNGKDAGVLELRLGFATADIWICLWCCFTLVSLERAVYPM
jgi:hypothetical protein